MLRAAQISAAALMIAALAAPIAAQTDPMTPDKVDVYDPARPQADYVLSLIHI